MNRNHLCVAIAAGLRVFNDASEVTIEELQNRLLDLSDSATNIQARADAEKRNLTEDERTEIDKISATYEDTEAEIERRQRVADMRAKTAVPQPRKTEADGQQDPANKAPARTPRVSGGDLAARNDTGKWGFRTQAEFYAAVQKSSQRGAQVDPRLIANAPTTYGSEGVGADGGFAVPPDFRSTIVEKVTGGDSLLGRTDQQTSGSNSITFPADETTPWQSSGGIQCAWEGENSQLTQSKPNLTAKTVRLAKLTALVPVTDELLADAGAMASYVARKAPQKMAYKVDDAIIRGSGAGQPLGILNSAGTITVTAESGQTADTVVFANITKAWGRLTPSARRNAAWLINPDVEPQLQSMQFPGSGTAVPVYLPPGGLSAAPYATLFGRPVIPHEGCSALGDAGDIILGDLQAYLSVIKTGGIRQDVSMHLWFDYDTLAFRFILRVGGQPWWNSAITAAQAGANTRGFFVTVGART